MRTTLTLDDDVTARIERMRESGRGDLKRLINTALRAGLDQMEHEREARTSSPYQVRGRHLGRRLPNVDNIGEVLAVGEGEDWR